MQQGMAIAATVAATRWAYSEGKGSSAVSLGFGTRDSGARGLDTDRLFTNNKIVYYSQI